MKRGILFLAIMLLASPAFAQVYKCVENGNTVYSDLPCAKTAMSEPVPGVSGFILPSVPAKCLNMMNRTRLSLLLWGNRDQDIVVGNLSNARLESIRRERGECVALKALENECKPLVVRLLSQQGRDPAIRAELTGLVSVAQMQATQMKKGDCAVLGEVGDEAMGRR